MTIIEVCQELDCDFRIVTEVTDDRPMKVAIWQHPQIMAQHIDQYHPREAIK